MPILALPGEEELLGEAGEGAEVDAAELRERGGFPVVEAVAAGEGFEDPDVYGEGFEFAGAEEEDAVGDFFADAGEGAEAFFGGGVGEGFRLLEPAGVGGEKAGGLADVAGAEAEEAGAELGLGDGGELRPGGEGVAVAAGERGAVAGGEEGDHLLDLHDLLGGAAEEAEERLPEGLTEEAEAGEGGEAAGEVGVAAPGERIGKGGEVAVGAEVVGERGGGGGDEGGGGAPLDLAGGLGEAEADEVGGPLAEPGGIGLALPAEGLAAVEGFGEDGRGEGWEAGEGAEGGPGGIYDLGITIYDWGRGGGGEGYLGRAGHRSGGLS